MDKKVKADFSQEMMQDLQSNFGIDVEDELVKMITESINKEILHKIARVGFGQKAALVKATNREGQINSIISDVPFIPENIEDTPEFKWLSDEDKENFRKYGKIDMS